jgi:single-strand DNA-binding protein
MYLNKVYVLGNLTRDPEMKALPSGGKVTQFSLATNRVWKDQNGQKQEQVEYHNIVVFGRPAETSAEYLKKGQQVLVEGRIQTRSWDGADGKKNYRTEIIADSVQFGSKTNGSSYTPPADTGSAPEMATISYGDDDINPDDIPF